MLKTQNRYQLRFFTWLKNQDFNNAGFYHDLEIGYLIGPRGVDGCRRRVHVVISRFVQWGHQTDTRTRSLRKPLVTSRQMYQTRKWKVNY